MAISQFGTSFKVGLPHGFSESKIENIWAYLDIFQLVSQKYGIGEKIPILCADCLGTYVLTNAQFKDGRWVKIGLTMRSSLEYLAAPTGTSVMLNYRTKVKLGDDVIFTSFFI